MTTLSGDLRTLSREAFVYFYPLVTMDVSRRQAVNAPADRRHDLELVRSLVQGQTRRLARYRCENCGFRARQFYWQCPACMAWETYPPRRTEEFDLAP